MWVQKVPVHPELLASYSNAPPLPANAPPSEFIAAWL